MLANYYSCSHDKAYISIIITVLPLWALLTTLIVSVLIASMSSIGFQSHHDLQQVQISDQLSFVDYTVLTYLFFAVLFHISTYDFLQDSFRDSAQAAYKGAIIGCCCFSLTLLIGITLRYLIKYYYSLKNGTGAWAIVYYLFCLFLVLPATGLWIYTAYVAYKKLCSNHYSMWLMSICVAVVESLALAVGCTLVAWQIQSSSGNYTEFVLPEELDPMRNSKNRASSEGQIRLSSKPLIAQPITQPAWQLHHQQQQATSSTNLPIQYVVQQGGIYSPQTSPNVYPTAPYLMNPMITNQQATSPYKAYQPTPYTEQQQQYSPYYPAPNPHQQVQQHQMPTITMQQLQRPNDTTTGYNTTGGGANPSSPEKKREQQQGIKKVGSSESTGSNYYRQLMKNKGGVKSISQYGELLKQKKGKK